MEPGHDWTPKPTASGEELSMMVCQECGNRRIPTTAEERCFVLGWKLRTAMALVQEIALFATQE